MNDETLDRLVAETALLDDASVQRLAVAEAEQTLLEAIMSTPRDPATLASRRRHRIRPRLLAPLAAAAVLVAAIVAVQTTQTGPRRAWAADIVAVARVAPRLLVDEPGWEVTRADEFERDRGEMTFAKGGRSLDLHWIPAGEHARRVDDRAHSAELRTTGLVNGHRAEVFRYLDSSEYVALWTQGAHSVEVRGSFPTVEAFRALLGRLIEVDIDTWLSAMPPSVVRPESRAAMVDEMLTDIPLPPGFDPTEVKQRDGLAERYNVGADTAGAVSCGWIERWLTAVDAGDDATAEQAVDAMATSREWKVLRDMNPQGDYPEVVWEYAAAMAHPAPPAPDEPHSVEGIRKTYRQAFCTPY